MANLLRAWRTERGWTLPDAGGLTGVSVSYLSLVERDLRQPTPRLKVQIAHGLGAQVGDLFPIEREQEAIGT